MSIMSAVRSLVPVPASPPQPSNPAGERAAAAQSVSAVAQPERPQSVRQPDRATGTVGLQLAAVEEDHEPVVAARAAAEAARNAYIRASIAAGVSALPLP
ncbi:MAG: hypothetical protein ACLGIE_10125 [Alphaproteobacteria bacterium]